MDRSSVSTEPTIQSEERLVLLLDILGFVGDIGSGLLYFIARSMDWGGGNIQRAVADYGTKFIVVAGLLNIIAAVDAHQIAIGKKS